MRGERGVGRGKWGVGDSWIIVSRHSLGAVICNLEVVDMDGLRSGSGRCAVFFPGQFVGPLTIDFDGAEEGWHLLDVAEELSAGLFNEGRGDVFVGVSAVDGTLQIVAGRGGPQYHGAAVDFLALLQFGDALGGFAHTDKQQSCGQRVKGSRMAYLHPVSGLSLFDVVSVTDGRLDLVDGLERGPLAWLVDGNDYAVEEGF